jgi:xanthine dehydrogenase accessory factor
MFVTKAQPITPVRHSWSERDCDVFAFLQTAASENIESALITIVSIEGGSPRAIGSHMAVLADGRYTGYVSGGCVEAAVASEAVRLIHSGQKNAIIRFGAGSRYLDIKLPCGGAIDLHFGINPNAKTVDQIVERLANRACFSVALEPLQLCDAGDDPMLTRAYVPETKLILFGNGVEMLVMARAAHALGIAIETFGPDAAILEQIGALGIPTTHVQSLNSSFGFTADPWTAIVSLFHDFDWEMAFLPKALATDAFYIGALGSPQTHRRRRDGLAEMGISAASLDRVRGPIGVVPATRNATALAVSVLAEITACRAALTKPK